MVKELNEPRLPSLKGKLNAKKAVVTKWTAADINADLKCLGLEGSPTKVVKIFSPPARQGGEMLQGTADETAAQVVDKLFDTVLGAGG